MNLKAFSSGLHHSSKQAQLGSLELRVMRAEDKPQVIQLISSSLFQRHPLLHSCINYFQMTEEEQLKGLQDYWTAYLHSADSSIVSVVAVDRSRSGQIVGVMLGADLIYDPNFTEKEQENAERAMVWMTVLEYELLEKAQSKKLEKLMTPGVTLSIDAVAVRQEWNQTNLTDRLIEHGMKQASLSRYQNAYYFPVMPRESYSFKYNSRWRKVAEIDVKNFDVEGLAPFSMVQQHQKMVSSWTSQIGQATNRPHL